MWLSLFTAQSQRKSRRVPKRSPDLPRYRQFGSTSAHQFCLDPTTEIASVLNTRSALDIRENLGQEKKVCLICGKFNVVHPGHLRLFRHAKEISDYLVLGILSDGLSQEFLLPVADRLEGVRANVWVDDAFVIESSIGEAISVLKPDVVLKGKEHENRRNPEKEAVEKYGGVLRFAGGDARLSSSVLLRAEQDLRIIRHATDYLQRHKLSQEMLATQIETMSQARVLPVNW